tara:strand:+ start:151 stop:546 length:396 start_codon:yes stop_codon:yes gene_type:complete
MSGNNEGGPDIINNKKTILWTMWVLIFALGCSTKEIPNHRVVQRNGLAYVGDDNTPVTGFIVKYYENGSIEERASFLDGRRDGLSQWFRPSGKLWMQANYKKGKKDGTRQVFNASGEIASSKEYVEGSLTP